MIYFYKVTCRQYSSTANVRYTSESAKLSGALASTSEPDYVEVKLPLF